MKTFQNDRVDQVTFLVARRHVSRLMAETLAAIIRSRRDGDPECLDAALALNEALDPADTETRPSLNRDTLCRVRLDPRLARVALGLLESALRHHRAESQRPLTSDLPISQAALRAVSPTEALRLERSVQSLRSALQLARRQTEAQGDLLFTACT